MKRLLTVIAWIIALQLISAMLAWLTQQGLDPWYAGLMKSALTPPRWLFPIVWPLLYVLLAIVGWQLWSTRHNHPLAWRLYAVQMLMNWAWTPLFFGLQWMIVAALWLSVMVVITLYLIVRTWSQQRLCSVLLLPYVAWISFASYLSITIALLNG